jgi:NAD(P)-dependent dehydrogenase (short-subunit alcohol dehydrogenase family)
MDAGLDGSVAVVVGCAQGIGLSSARLLAQRGASVVLADLDGDTAAKNAQDIVLDGGRAVAVACDVRDRDSMHSVMAEAVSRFGRLDILHNNAAGMHLLRTDGAVLDMDAGVWDATMQTNLRGQLFGIQAALPHMLAQGEGAIVNTSSVSGLTADLALTAYGASKAAIIHLTRSVATQYGRGGVRCNAVVPGFIPVERPTGSSLSEASKAQHRRQQLLDVLGEPLDVARAVAFLAGPEARFVTGQTLVVDGGLTAHTASYADSIDAASHG